MNVLKSYGPIIALALLLGTVAAIHGYIRTYLSPNPDPLAERAQVFKQLCYTELDLKFLADVAAGCTLIIHDPSAPAKDQAKAYYIRAGILSAEEGELDLTAGIALNPPDVWRFYAARAEVRQITFMYQGRDGCSDAEMSDRALAIQYNGGYSGSGELYKARAKCFLRQNDYDEAIADLERAITQDPKSEFYYRSVQSDVYKKARQLHRVVDMWRKYVVSAPNDISVQNEYMQSLIVVGDYVGALEQCTKNMDVFPEYKVAWLLKRADIHMLYGDINSAETDYYSIVELGVAAGKDADLELRSAANFARSELNRLAKVKR